MIDVLIAFGVYILGVAVGFMMGALWAAGYVHRKAGVRPYDLKRQV